MSLNLALLDGVGAKTHKDVEVSMKPYLCKICSRKELGHE